MRVATAGPTSALFLPGVDASVLLGLCARLALDPTSRVFPVDGGFVVTLPQPPSRPLAGVTRLRTLAPHIYVPVDADLVPALLDDEAMSLGRDRGMVFLPWGAVLGFA